MTTHIGMDLLKREWEVFWEVWKNLKNDSIEWTDYYRTLKNKLFIWEPAVLLVAHDSAHAAYL